MRRAPLALAALLAAGCPARPAGDGRNPPPLDKSYPDGAAGLSALWTDIVTAARRDERERVHTLMASLIMTDDDLRAVFGDERFAAIQPRYLPMIATLVNIGSMELVAQIHERKYDDVEVLPIAETGSREDRATLRVLKTKVPVYSVRVKRKGETRGLRYDFFLYRNGRWVTGNQLAKYFVDELPDGAPPRDGGR